MRYLRICSFLQSSTHSAIDQGVFFPSFFLGVSQLALSSRRRTLPVIRNLPWTPIIHRRTRSSAGRGGRHGMGYGMTSTLPPNYHLHHQHAAPWTVLQAALPSYCCCFVVIAGLLLSMLRLRCRGGMWKVECGGGDGGGDGRDLDEDLTSATRASSHVDIKGAGFDHRRGCTWRCDFQSRLQPLFGPSFGLFSFFRFFAFFVFFDWLTQTRPVYSNDRRNDQMEVQAEQSRAAARISSYPSIPPLALQ